MTAYLRHSITVVLFGYNGRQDIERSEQWLHMGCESLSLSDVLSTSSPRDGVLSSSTHFPQPFAPTIMVKGNMNSTTCSSSSGEKARTPRIESLLMDAITLSPITLLRNESSVMISSLIFSDFFSLAFYFGGKSL